STDEKTHAPIEVQERIRLFGPVYTTMLVTHTPTYRPGETLRFRSLTLDRTSFRPPEREQILEYALFNRYPNGVNMLGRSVNRGTELVRITGGKVEPVLVNGTPIRGVGTGELTLPNDLADGDYKLVLKEL